ncbi:TetR family transcriptional regulator [Pedobacter cryoconitis]|uniref:TetR family transcriptional regulator n=2 Tax=Pedobacter cryoconitis TaxID=188932 RepID=A0A327SQ56_9SPHI|nr:TetR family transcriptional regulator [Pedobacter cryoconitis]
MELHEYANCYAHAHFIYQEATANHENIRPMKNKENTKRKLLDAVGVILKKDGFGGLGVNKVAKLAGVSKILIYRYFGDFNELVKSCVVENDFWTNNLTEPAASKDTTLSMQQSINMVLKERFNYFYDHCQMQAALLNDTSDYNIVIKKRSGSNRLLKRKLQPAKGQGSDNCITYFNIVSTLLVAGTNHLVLGNHDETKNELQHSMEKIVEWTFGDVINDKDYN